MPRYRVTTPDTDRVPGTNYADFQAGEIAHSPVCVRNLLSAHNYVGCTVHRKAFRHWSLIFDSSTRTDKADCADYWRRVQADQ